METSSFPYGCERWFDLKSSMVVGAGVREGWLVVRFVNGSFYRYANAAERLDELMKAESVGQYFNRRIKSTYAYTKLTEPTWPEGEEE